LSSFLTLDPGYSPEYQDTYQRLWHEAAAERDRFKQAIKTALYHWPGEAHLGKSYYALVDVLEATHPWIETTPSATGSA